MAENECLDVRTSHRWIAVIRTIRERRMASDIDREIKTALARSWTAVRKQFRKAELTLEKVVQAAADGDSVFLEKAYRDSKYHRFIRLIGNCPRLMDSSVDVLERAVRAQLRIARDQIRDTLVDRGHCSNFQEADRLVTPAFERVAPDAAAFARRLIDTPVKAAKLLAGIEPTQTPTSAMINMSLINPAAPPIGIGP